jgi:hypothetical protein
VISFERSPAGLLEARATLRVGVERHDVRMELGAWPDDGPDPSGPLGLAGTPVVVLPDARWTDLAMAGALRSGRRPACLRLPADAPRLGIQLLVAVTEGADVVFVEDGGGAALMLARTLGGRPVAVLPLDRPADIERFLDGSVFDLHIAVPALDEPLRAAIRAALAPLALEARHHLVDVDPTPAFAEAEVDADRAPLDAHAAAAAGVLAGRLAAANRRWRADAGR